MKKKIVIPLFALLVIASTILFFDSGDDPVQLKRIRSADSPKSSVETKAGRYEYFHKLYRDPVTDEIPKNIRAKELEFAKILRPDMLSKSSDIETLTYTWKEAGPDNVGGRTRALAVDIKNSDVILAGGISGGMWKSTNKGKSWKMKSTTEDYLSVTTLAQDPRDGKTNIWYYGTGEWTGNSAKAKGAYFSGTGIYKSLDNGETWNLLIGAGTNNKWNSYFDYVQRIIVSPITGSMFASTHGGYIYRFKDGEDKPEKILGGTMDHYFTDVVVNKEGTLLAIISEYGRRKYYEDKQPVTTPGIYVSKDDGDTWKYFTPEDFPQQHYRSRLAFAPSADSVAYCFTYGGKAGGKEKIYFFKINIADSTFENRTANLPAFSSRTAGMNLQGGYNMMLAVKPDDKNFVLLGMTNLYRSANGFATKPANTDSSKMDCLIGGYGIKTFMYRNSHPDIHSFAWDPNNSNAFWNGHDGGLSYTSDITQKVTYEFPWENKNKSYNVTQFYTVSISQNKYDNRIVGGTQDNGSPYIKYLNKTPADSKGDLSSGDGAFCYWGKEDVFVSSQSGKIVRLGLAKNGGNPPLIYNGGGYDWAMIVPKDAKGQSFINPFTVDPNDEKVLYYLAGSSIWRNKNVHLIPDYTQTESSIGWENLNTQTSGKFSALSVSRSNKKHVLYLGVYSNNKPYILRIDSSNVKNKITTEYIFNEATKGSFIKSIAINPNNSDEILVAMSNYNIVGLYHSKDGGKTFKAVEGNLIGTKEMPGPSIRAAEIMVFDNKKLYVVGTSVGLFSTAGLYGDDTEWKLEGKNQLGNVIVNYIASRTSDGRIVAATHGRGLFVGKVGLGVGVEENTITTPKEFALEQNYPNPFNPSTTIEYSIPKAGHVLLKVYDTIGKEVKTLVDKNQNEGNHKIIFNANNLSSGVYIYRLSFGNRVETKKLMLIK